MISKSKRIAALVLTAMMASASLAGCTDGGGSTTSTPAATPSTSSNSSSSEKLDLSDDATINQMKDMIAEEAKKAEDGKTVKLKIWCSSDDLKIEQYVIDEFTKKFGDSRYDIKISKTSIEEPDVSSKVSADIDKAADVFSMPDDQIRDLAESGKLAQVSDVLLANVKAENTAESVEVCSIDNVAYAFPKSSDNGYFLYYDKRYLKEDDVKDFDTLIAKCKAANKSVLYPMNNAWYNSGFYFTAGCTVSYDGKTMKQEADYDSDKGLSAVKAMAHICESVGNGYVGEGDNATILSGFQDGSLAAAVTGTWNGPGIEDSIGKENLGAVKLPTVLMDGEQKQLWSFGGYKVLGVRSNSNFPGTAQLYAYFSTSKEMQMARCLGTDSVKARGFVPTNNEALADDKIKDMEATKAIEAQRPFSKPQSLVGGKYWSPTANLGGELLTNKGKYKDDAELKERIKRMVEMYNKVGSEE